jgi:hypothetical protein
MNTQKILKLFSYLRAFWPLFLSHHPECRAFDNHTLNIGKIRFCIGCFIGYPTALLGIFGIDFFKLYRFIPFDYFLIISIVLLSTFFLSPLHLTENKKVKIIQKIMIGLGASFLFWYIMSRPNPRIVNIFTFYISFSLLLGVLNLYHVLGFVMKCYKCDTPFLWGVCGGFKSIVNHFEKYGLENFFLSFEDFSESIKERRSKKE